MRRQRPQGPRQLQRCRRGILKHQPATLPRRRVVLHPRPRRQRGGMRGTMSHLAQGSCAGKAPCVRIPMTLAQFMPSLCIYDHVHSQCYPEMQHLCGNIDLPTLLHRATALPRGTALAKIPPADLPCSCCLARTDNTCALFLHSRHRGQPRRHGAA